MRRSPSLPTRVVLLSVFVGATGCREGTVPRSQAPSPENSAANAVSIAAPAENETNSSLAPPADRLAATRRVSEAERDSPTTANTVEQIVELLESAKYKSQTDDGKEADVDYRRAGELAAQLLDHRSELTRKELRVGAIASYFAARALARGSEPQQALPAIERAFSAGFEDLERLDSDPELAPVRALPEYAAFRAALETRLAEDTRNQIQQQLQAFDPYPLEFRLPNLDGTDVSLAELRGKVVVLAFWGTWCVKCQAEVPTLNRLQKAYGERGVQVIGPSYEEVDDNSAAIERIREFQKTTPVDYLCLLGDEATRDQVRPPDDAPPEWVFPVTLILDQQGRVRLHFTGEVSYGKLEAAVKMLLDGV